MIKVAAPAHHQHLVCEPRIARVLSQAARSARMTRGMALIDRGTPAPGGESDMARTDCWSVVSMLVLLLGMPAALGADGPAEADDPYRRYILTAPEFQPVRQEPAFLIGRWDTWIYMPWRYQWTIGTGETGGRFCREFGFNGGFTDHGEGALDWLQRWGLRFYNDHTAGKGDLHLRGSENRSTVQADQHNPRAIRHGTDGPRPIDANLRRRLRDR